MALKNKKDQLDDALKKVQSAEADLQKAKNKLCEARKDVTKIRKEMAAEAKSKRLKDPQDMKLLSKFPVEVKDKKIEVLFEAINGNLKWPAVLTSSGFKCVGTPKGRRRCSHPSRRLPERHSEKEMKDIIFVHAACCIGEKRGHSRPNFPIIRSYSK